MKKLCMEKKVFPEAEAEILCSGRVREENFPNPAAGVAILRRSCYCKGTEKKPCKPSGTMKIRCGTGSMICKNVGKQNNTTQNRTEKQSDTFRPEFGYRVLQYLCENGVQPEIWQDVVAELDAAQQTEQEGGAWRGQ